MDAELALDKAGAIFSHIKSISSKWYEIGSRLGLCEESLQRIRSSRGNQAEKALNEVIFAWLHGKDNAKQKGATWNTLIRALKHRSVKEADLAATIEADLLKDSTPPKKTDSQTSPTEDPRLKILKNHIPDLISAVTDPETYVLATHFCCAEIVSSGTSDDIITNKSLSRQERAVLLFNAISKQLKLSKGEKSEVIFQKVCSILSQQENLSLERIASQMWKVDHLSQPLPAIDLPECNSSVIKEFQDHLKREYIDQTQQSVNAWPRTISVDYVNLQIVEAAASKQNQIAQLSQQGGVADIISTCKKIPLKEIVDSKPQQQSRGKLAIVEGAPGIGKTTVANKICQDWAKGECFSEYELVIYIPLRILSVKVSESLPDLMQMLDYYNDHFESMSQVVQYIRKKRGKDILFIMDGWDELNQTSLDETAFLPRFIKGTLFPNMDIIVTSRPSVTRSIRTKSFCPTSKLVQIVGFTEDNIKEYIYLYFSENRSVAQELLKQLQCYPKVMSACYVAINATIICYVYEAENRLPDTLTEVYYLFVLHAVKRHINKSSEKNEDELEAENFTEFKKDRQELFLKLCNLALEGLLSNNFSFKRNELRESCNIHEKDIFDGFGLVQFYEVRTTRGTILYSYFLHLTIQEFLAAYAIYKKDKEKQFDILGTMFIKHPLTVKFLSGLCEGNDSALDHFIYTDDISPLLLMECVHESNNMEKCNDIAKRYANHLCIKQCHLLPYQALACGNVMIKSRERWTLEWNDSDIGKEELSTLYRCLQEAPNTLSSIVVIDSKFISEDAKEMMEILAKSQLCSYFKC